MKLLHLLGFTLKFMSGTSQVQSSIATVIPKPVKIFLVVVTYWTVSITLVFANKYLLGNKSSHDVSLFVAWIQCIITVTIVLLNTALKSLMTGEKPSFAISRETSLSRPMVMLTCSYVGMLTFNNLCLKHVSVSFYQVARSMTLIFVVIFSLVILKVKVSWRIWVCCFVVAGGFVLGVDQENLSGTLSVQGVLFGVITSLFVSLNGIFTKQALDVVDRNSVQLTLLNNINASVVFFPLLLLTGQFQTVFQEPEFHNTYFWGFLLVTGFLCFGIAWISAVQINITSPVTHHISANCKAVLQTTIAVLYHGELKSLLWWTSICMVIGGAFSYAVIRIKEEKEAKSLPKAHDSNLEHKTCFQANGDVK